MAAVACRTLPAHGPLDREFCYSDAVWMVHRQRRDQADYAQGVAQKLALMLQLLATRGAERQLEPAGEARVQAAAATEQPEATKEAPPTALSPAAEVGTLSYRVRDGTRTVSLEVPETVTVAAFCELAAERLRPQAAPGVVKVQLSYRGAGSVVDLSAAAPGALLRESVPDKSTLSARVSEPSAAELAALRTECRMLEWENQRLARELRGLQVLVGAMRGEKPAGEKAAPLQHSGQEAADPARLRERNTELRAVNARLVVEMRGMEAFAHRLHKGAGDATRAWRGSVVQGRVLKMPGDGGCLFHSLAHGLGPGETAAALRREVCDFIEHEPDTLLAGKPLRDWVLWEAGQSHEDYVATMRSSSEWGGPLEIAVCSHKRRADIHVYQEVPGGFQRLVAFDVPGGGSTGLVSVLFSPGHYDALEVEVTSS